jgi:hypothetical protein
MRIGGGSDRQWLVPPITLMIAICWWWADATEHSDDCQRLMAMLMSVRLRESKNMGVRDRMS